MLLKKPIINILGYISLFLGISMFLVSLFPLINGQPDLHAFLISGIVTIFISSITLFFTREIETYDISLKDGFYIVTIGWILAAIFCSLPFYLSPQFFPTFADAVFESMSGITTTGATVLSGKNIGEMSNGLLFWRSFIQFIGGMGIILFSIAILPLLGKGGVQLFRAEVAGPNADKITPRVKQTAKYLWSIYLILIFAEIIILYLEGLIFDIDNMSLFNAVCHSMTTIATAGFSTLPNGINDFNSTIVELTIVIFMLLGATNFTLHYLFLFKGKFEYTKDREIRYYLGILLLMFILIFSNLFSTFGFSSFSHSLFNTVSILTTTGYSVGNYESWPSLSKLLIFIMFFIGGTAGSTAGGIKIMRTILVFKYIRSEVSKMMHPKGVYPIMIGKNSIPDDVVRNTLGFYLFYIFIFVIGSVVFALNGESVVTAVSASAASIGNIGPAFGDVGPLNSWGGLNPFSKFTASFCMLLGRLEIFTVIVLFTKTFWKK